MNSLCYIRPLTRAKSNQISLIQRMKKCYLLLIIFISISMNAQDSITLTIPINRYQIDSTNGIIICNSDISKFPELGSYDSVALALDSTFNFTSNPGKISHKTSYTVEKGGTEYRLYFSKFPLIAIKAPQILDEPKKPATFVYADLDGIKKSDMGIETRGGSSQYFPKKTYDLEFWEDATGDDNKDMQFCDLREDDDWILDALYNEPLRLRAFSAHKLWLDLHSPFYLAEEEDAKSGADVMYVDVFLNNTYNGIYMLSEQVDSKQLELKSFKKDKIRGELYKSEAVLNYATYFANATPYDNTKERWDGFELKHPDEDERIDWSKLHGFVDFVANSSDGEFDAGIAERVHVGNALDYFIFLNVLRAADNRGKNYYIAKYNQDNPYFFVPWDLDGTFGLKFDGTYASVTDGILSNTLFDRLFKNLPTEGIKQKVYARYTELRLGVLSKENILKRLGENYNLLKENKIYEREALVWANYPFDKEAKTYIDDWMMTRMDFLDQYFAGFNLGITTQENKQQKFLIYPNPASSFISVESDIESKTSYKIYTIQGQSVQLGSIDPVDHKINVQRLNTGMYLLAIGNTTQKILIEH